MGLKDKLEILVDDLASSEAITTDEQGEKAWAYSRCSPDGDLIAYVDQDITAGLSSLHRETMRASAQNRASTIRFIQTIVDQLP